MSYGSFINNRPILVGISLPQSQFTTHLYQHLYQHQRQHQYQHQQY
jgi:hypothetical protein